MMRLWLSVVALALALALLTIFWDDGTAPQQTHVLKPTPVTAATTKGLYFGSTADVEFVLRPYYADPERAEFADQRLGRLLGAPKGSKAYLLWVINHAKSSVELPENFLSELTSPDPSFAAHSFDDLMGAAKSDIDDHAGRLFVSLSTIMAPRRTVPPGSLMRYGVFLSENDPPNEITLPLNPPILLEKAEIRQKDLENFHLEPKGRFALLLRLTPGASTVGNVDTDDEDDGR